MKWNLEESLNNQKLIVLGYLALIIFIIFGFVVYTKLKTAFVLSEEVNKALTIELENLKKDNAELLSQLEDKQAIIDAFSGQIQNISSTVGTLEKLSQTDEELLQKYSKVYFLNENYVPSKLIDIDEEYVYNGSTNYLIHGDVWPYMKRLLDRAKDEEVELLVASAFRSFDTQASLKSNYTFTYGSGANQFSADQGYSEHQLGTSVDFTTPKVGGIFSGFEADPAYEWLLDNAHRYGFILSYPKGNTYYKFEPWHWRFVGVELATYLYEEKKNFYDLTQREIDAYLVKLFD
ncbi:MAG: D-alanyl-D-alanine carboxypeptidase family protein [Parcubacteria group bacterium]